jgi:hypothetical protein
MYVLVSERLGRLQDIKEQEREFKALKSRFAVAKTENERPLSPLLGDVLPQGVLKRAGLQTTTRVDSKTAPLIQSALEQSRVLRPFIAAKLKSVTIPRNFVVHGWDATFDSAYLKLHKIVVPFGSKEEKELLNIRGFYHRPTDSIHLRPSATVGLALRLAIHKFSSPAFRGFFGKSIGDGLSLYFTNRVLAEQDLAQLPSEQYGDQLRCATNLIDLVGITMVGKAYFENHLDLVRHLTTNLSTGPVRTAELARDALCTARFDNQRFQQRCRNFFKEYELSFNPDRVKFGVGNNPRMTQSEKEERKRDVMILIAPLRGRFGVRAAAALHGQVPAGFPALTQPVKTIVQKFSSLQFNLFRKWFPAGNGIHFFSVQHCFEQFANGELRDPSEIGHPGLFEPDSAAYFLFAEFAFLCLELGHKKSFWEPALRTFVKTQEIFMHVYREHPKSPPPPVDDPLPPLGGSPRDLGLFDFRNFKQLGSSVTIGEGQSDLKRKMALRAKYDRMGESALKVAARDNLRRAQLMP